MRILLLGGGAREHAIGAAVCRSGQHELFVVSHNDNPGLQALATRFVHRDESDPSVVVDLAQRFDVDIAVVGLEDPLAAGIPDRLYEVGIPTVGPGSSAARIETSKVFLRELMERHKIPGKVIHKYFRSVDQLTTYLYDSSPRQFALKPIGLTGGKGVKVMGVQLTSISDAVEYGRKVIEQGIGGDAGILVEERLEGVEFTLQAFVDGSTVVPMPLVKDYKLAYEGERGPNTGSMGSYSDKNGELAFVSPEHHVAAFDIVVRVVSALSDEGYPYRGFIYGQFMITNEGPRVIEFNARFGDPEAINALALLETDFVGICKAIVDRKLDTIDVAFSPSATICTYITPPGYPDCPRESTITMELEAVRSVGVEPFFAKVSGSQEVFKTSASRSLALLAVADDLEAAHSRIELALKHVHGEYHVRRDIGTKELRLASESIHPILEF